MTEAVKKGGIRWGRMALIGIPFIWLFLFFLAPFFIVLRISLSDSVLARPPYVPVFEPGSGLAGVWNFILELDLESFFWLFEDSLYFSAYLSSLKIALIATAITLTIAYPIAYGIARSSRAWRPTLMMLVILPFWTSFLIRIYAWMGILQKEGYLNQFLIWTGMINEPLTMINTNFAVYIGIVYSYLPLMILPIYAALERLDDTLLEAAEDLGCSRFQAFWLITFPLSIPGVIAGCLLMFIPAVGEFVIPELLGGARTLMIGKVLWQEFFSNRDWPVASAVAIIMLIILVAPIVLFRRHQESAQEAQT